MTKGVVQVGIGVFITRKVEGRHQLLMGYRIGSHGADEWAAPGGKPDLWESPVDAGIRETAEETSLVLSEDETHFLCYTDDRFPDFGRHFVTLFFWTDEFQGTPKILEPTKCREWKWFDIEELPPNMMAGTKQAVKALRHVLHNIFVAS